MKVLKTLLFGLLLLAIITFSLRNTESVRFGYFSVIDSFEVPLFLLILLSIFLGMLIGAVADLIGRHRLRRAVRRQQRIRYALQKELIASRNLLLTGSGDDKGEATGTGEDDSA